jgi:hypothetical protein
VLVAGDHLLIHIADILEIKLIKEKEQKQKLELELELELLKQYGQIFHLSSIRKIAQHQLNLF